MSNMEQQPAPQSRNLKYRLDLFRLLPVTEGTLRAADSGRSRMPAFQSVLNSGLSRKYYLKAVGCEKSAEHASDLTTEQQWRELAEQWLSLACRAERPSGDASLDEPE
jgi:hypothetical protein